MSFYALRISFEKIYYTIPEETDKLFWARLNEKFFAYVGKRLEHLESREILCVHFLKVLNVLVRLDYTTLQEWIRCLHSDSESESEIYQRRQVK